MNKDEFGSQPPVDEASALERIGHDRSFLRELLEMYIEDFKVKFAELKKAIEETNFSGIQELGHYLKGSSANLGMEPLRELFYKIEFCGREQDPQQAQQYISKLQHEFDRLLEYFAGMDE